jgi:deoxycytidine triphosphate deaminase
VGLILGRFSLIAKGITVHTGVIDSDFEGELIVLLSCKGLESLEKGICIAQLVIFPTGFQMCPMLFKAQEDLGTQTYIGAKLFQPRDFF